MVHHDPIPTEASACTPATFHSFIPSHNKKFRSPHPTPHFRFGKTSRETLRSRHATRLRVFLSSFRRFHFFHFDGCPIHPTSHPRAIVSGIPPNSAAVSVNELQYEPMSRCVRDKTKRSTTAASIPSRVARVGSPA